MKNIILSIETLSKKLMQNDMNVLQNVYDVVVEVEYNNSIIRNINNHPIEISNFVLFKLCGFGFLNQIDKKIELIFHYCNKEYKVQVKKYLIRNDKWWLVLEVLHD